MEQKNPIDEARRYYDNAKTILKEKAVKDGDYYTDSKYVKMAGDTAWKGCLIALDSVFDIKKKTRKSIDDYKAEAAKRDKKLLQYVISGYNLMHLCMGYDGEKSYKVSVSGLTEAKNIIDWCEKRCKPLSGLRTPKRKILSIK